MRCVQGCPKQAFELDKSALLFDQTICDGCGLCVKSCPQQAILVEDIKPSLREDGIRGGDGMIAFAACEHTDFPSETVIPCVHSIGLFALLKLFGRGVQKLLVTTGDCQKCARLPASSFPSLSLLSDHIETLNMVLQSRQSPKLVYEEVSQPEWQKRWKRSENISPTNQDRRNFLKFATQVIALEDDEDIASQPATIYKGLPKSQNVERQAVDESAAAPLFFYVPEISATKCVGCHACTAICPHGAISYQTAPVSTNEGSKRQGYVIKPDLCSGCNLCIDICDEEAIRLRKTAPQKQSSLRLVQSHCKKCGVPYQLPVKKAAKSELCPICAKSKHRNQLFQIHP